MPLNTLPFLGEVLWWGSDKQDRAGTEQEPKLQPSELFCQEPKAPSEPLFQEPMPEPHLSAETAEKFRKCLSRGTVRRTAPTVPYINRHWTEPGPSWKRLIGDQRRTRSLAWKGTLNLRGNNTLRRADIRHSRHQAMSNWQTQRFMGPQLLKSTTVNETLWWGPRVGEPTPCIKACPEGVSCTTHATDDCEHISPGSQGIDLLTARCKHSAGSEKDARDPLSAQSAGYEQTISPWPS